MQQSFFKKLEELNEQRQSEWDTTREGLGLLFKVVELCGEVGELANEIKKVHREQVGLVGSRSSMQAVEDEFGDLIICTALLAKELGIDIEQATINKFNKTSAKHNFKTIWE